jgi:hypothetical protein
MWLRVSDTPRRISWQHWFAVCPSTDEWLHASGVRLLPGGRLPTLDRWNASHWRRPKWVSHRGPAGRKLEALTAAPSGSILAVGNDGHLFQRTATGDSLWSQFTLMRRCRISADALTLCNGPHSHGWLNVPMGYRWVPHSNAPAKLRPGAQAVTKVDGRASQGGVSAECLFAATVDGRLLQREVRPFGVRLPSLSARQRRHGEGQYMTRGAEFGNEQVSATAWMHADRFEWTDLGRPCGSCTHDKGVFHKYVAHQQQDAEQQPRKLSIGLQVRRPRPVKHI